MHKITSLLVVGALLGLMGCTAVNPEAFRIISCDSYASTLTTLAGFKAAGKLSTDQIATVDKWRPTLNAACQGSASTDDILDDLETGQLALLGIKRTVTP